MFAGFLPAELELWIAERELARLRGLVEQLDIAIANYADAHATLRARLAEYVGAS